ncbi:MAG: NAD-dependent epimerase/dehydratase family protein [Spirochaetes bacterium]|jgi:nucleoside-diphosphate-sugar epimerase|nr:NAD-dependent epimerase/dehydratase family protein [Spirochaetota bacterium]
MRVLLTGGTGFVGYNLVPALKQQGHEIVCLIRTTSNTTLLEELGGMEYAVGELNDPASLRAALDGVDAVVHLAGAVKAVRRDGYFAVNTEGTRNLVEAVREVCPGLKRFVYVSSLAAGGPSRPGQPRTEQDEDGPVTHYGRSKKAAEDIILGYREEMPSVILRPATVYGPADVALLGFFRSASRGVRARLMWRDLSLSMVYAEDLAGAVVRSLVSQLPSGDLFYVSDGREYRLDEVQEQIGATLGFSTRSVPLPRSLLYLVAALSEVGIRLTGRARFLNWQKIIEAVQPAWTCSPQKLETRTGFRPRYDLPDGARATAEWYRTRGWLPR